MIPRRKSIDVKLKSFSNQKKFDKSKLNQYNENIVYDQK